MASQSTFQTTAGGSSSSAPATTIQRDQIRKEFNRDTKTKTAKCNLCDGRVTSYSMQCPHCKKRICSECIEDQGDRDNANKTIAADHLENGCWCGFKSKHNPAFNGRMPVPAPAVPAKKKQPTAAAAAKKTKATAAETKPPGSVRASRSKKKDPETSEPTKAIDDSQDDVKAPRPVETTIDQAATSTKRRHSEEDEPETVAAPPPKKRKGRAQQTNEVRTSQTSSGESQETQNQQTLVIEPSADTIQAAPNGRPKGKGKARAQQTSMDTIDDENPSKRGTKRTRGDAPDSEDTAPTKKRKASNTDSDTAKPAPPKQNTRTTRGSAQAKKTVKQTVIVGAGIIGLFAAYELAKKTAKDEEDHAIIVVDINEKECSLASGHCSGFLTINGMSEDCLPLLEASIPTWNDLLDDDDFRKSVWLSNNNFVASQPGHCEVSWFRPSSGDISTLANDDDTLARLSTPQLGAWLRRECERLGVEFKFNCHPASLARGKLKLIHHEDKTFVWQKNADDGHWEVKSEHLKFDNLILAAGPFTVELFSRLFPESGTKLLNHVQSSEWATFPAEGVDKSIGVTVPSHDEDLRLASCRPSSAVKLSVCRRAEPTKKLLLRDAVDHSRSGKSASLREVASELLPISSGPPLSLGAMYVSTGKGQNPVVSTIPGLAFEQGRVVVAYGFGNCGTMLAPGVGREVVRLVCGGENRAFGVSA